MKEEREEIKKRRKRRRQRRRKKGDEKGESINELGSETHKSIEMIFSPLQVNIQTIGKSPIINIDLFLH